MTTRRPSQEFIYCFCLFHNFPFGLPRDRDATPFAVGFTNDLSVLTPGPAGQAGRVAGELHIGLARTVMKSLF